MSKANIIIDGAGLTATFNSVAIADINSISLNVFGERETIRLTTVDATNYEVGVLGDLLKIDDIVISKKSDPAADLAIVKTNATLVIVYKVGKSTTKTLTCWAQRKSIGNSTVERSPSDGINCDITFKVTNLNGSLVETGPVIA